MVCRQIRHYSISSGELSVSQRSIVGSMKQLLMVVIALLVAPSVSLSSRAQSPAERAANVTDTEYQVLAAYITDTFMGNKGQDRVGRQVSRIVIANKTQSDQEDQLIEDENGKAIPWGKTSRFLHKQSSRLQTSTLNSFRDANRHPAPLRRLFQLRLPYELVDKAEFDAIFENDGWWTDYYKKYPDSQGFLTLSRIGFSADGKQAMFYSTNGCGGKCGTGTYVVMEKVGASWQVVKEILIWVS